MTAKLHRWLPDRPLDPEEMKKLNEEVADGLCWTHERDERLRATRFVIVYKQVRAELYYDAVLETWRGGYIDYSEWPVSPSRLP